ncbi:hypothetical protein NIES4071_01890 [Calothrix sp. NIES-4071]|nr:hypothetical protein NIES4071_01890 [Calothrix sp. NIES-4071]BAZ54535.1 hypothetical protein NIES4105_01880 [Calothrix sp. NIES-4105]
MANEATAFLKDEWLEAFWCDECQQTNWYHIKKVDVNDAQTQSESITYQVLTALPAHWQQTISAIFPPELLLQQDYQQNS